MGQRPSVLDSSIPSEKHIDQSATGMTSFRYQSSSTTQQEHTPPYTYVDGAVDQSEWNVRTSEVETQDDSSPQNPFVYDGARSANVARRKNVILFGETGVGKSSVVNLMAGAEVAQTSPNLEGCTMEATEYSFTLPGENPLRIYDTVGLNESHMGVNTFFGAIEKAHQLISSLHGTGGVDLLLFCIRGSRITATMQRNYRLFFEFLCEKKVPLAFVVTNLEFENVMEDWWTRNEETFKNYGIQSVAHACITAAPARLPMITEKRVESRCALQKMLHDALSSDSTPYVREVRSWFASLIDMLWSFLIKRLPASLQKKELSKRLETRCALPPDEAQQLADMLTRNR